MKRSQLHPTTLREIADVEGIQVGPFGSQLHVADYVERGVAVVMPSQMSNGAIDFGTCAKITASKAKELETHALRPGDLIFARRGDVGRLAVYSQRDPVAICGTGCIRVRLRVGVSASIVAEACMHPVAQQWLISNAVGMTMLNLNQSTLGRLPIRMPLLEHHSAILRFTGAIDRTIGYLDALIAAKREQKRGLMQQLLTGKVRFPGFTEPWKTVRLGELGLIKSGGTPATGESAYWGGPHAWCTPTDVTALQTRHLSRTSRTITDAGMRASAAELLPPKSVIVCTRATVGIAAINTVPMSMNQGFKAIVPRRDVDGDFLYYAISHAKADLLRRAAGSTFIEVSMTSFKDIAIRWPSSFAEQRRIATLLAGVDLEIELLSSQRAAFALQRRGLMERLLSGDITIPSSDTSAA